MTSDTYNIINYFPMTNGDSWELIASPVEMLKSVSNYMTHEAIEAPTFSDELLASAELATGLNPQLAMAAFGAGVLLGKGAYSLAKTVGKQTYNMAVNNSGLEVTEPTSQPQTHSKLKAFGIGAAYFVGRSAQWMLDQTLSFSSALTGGYLAALPFTNASVKHGVAKALYPWVSAFPNVANAIKSFDISFDAGNYSETLIQQYESIANTTVPTNWMDSCMSWNTQAVDWAQGYSNELQAFCAKHIAAVQDAPSKYAYDLIEKGVEYTLSPAFGFMHLMSKAGLKHTVGQLHSSLASDSAAYVLDTAVTAVVAYYGLKTMYNVTNGYFNRATNASNDSSGNNLRISLR